jgi:hypothetical protein
MVGCLADSFLSGPDADAQLFGSDCWNAPPNEGAETDMLSLTSPRHPSTPPMRANIDHSSTAWQGVEIHAKWATPVCFQRRSNALIVPTWGMAVVRDFRTVARAAPPAAHERPGAVAPHGRPAAVAHGQPAAVGEPMVVAAGH